MAWKGKKKDEDEGEKKSKGPPPPGCGLCRHVGAINVTVVQYGPPPLRARSATDYACRCDCARGRALFPSLPSTDDFVASQVRKSPGIEVMIDALPNERAGLPPSTLEDAIEVQAGLSATLTANPGWKIGQAVMHRAGARRRAQCVA